MSSKAHKRTHLGRPRLTQRQPRERIEPAPITAQPPPDGTPIGTGCTLTPRRKAST